MILTKNEILKAVKEKKVKITPFDKKSVGPASIDLTLDNKFRVFRNVNANITVNEDFDYKSVSSVVEGSIMLKPGAFVHGITKEKIKLPDNLCGILTGRSTFASMGILIHATASFIQPGVNNKQVFEIKNISNNTLMLEEGTKIGQLVLMQTKGKARYNNKYKNQGKV
jgi:dCTP deaminase